MSKDENMESLNVEKENQTGFTLRAFIIGIIFVVIIGVIVPFNMITIKTSRLSSRVFSMGVGIVLILCIFIGNMLMKKIIPPLALKSKEILVIMVIAWIGLAFPGAGGIIFVPTIAGAAQYGTSTNKYFDTYFKGVDAINIKDQDIDKIRSLTKEELDSLQEAFSKTGSREAFKREYYRAKDGEEAQGISPDEFETYEKFLNSFEHAEWDSIVPYDTVEVKSIQGPTDDIYYFFNGFPPRYTGPSTGRVVMNAWLWPLMLWAAFFLGICIMVFCIMTILRKQWVEKEKLLFPITKVPIELVQGLDDKGNPLLRNKLLWFGVLLPILVGAYRYFAFQTKLMPELPQGIPGGLTLPQNIAHTYLNLLGVVVGFTYLVNLDISFSLWFFHLLGLSETGFFNFIQFGTSAGKDFYSFGTHSYVNHQSVGGGIALVVIGLWFARKHLWAVLKKALGFNVPELDDADEPVSYRFAVLGLMAASLFCTGWLMVMGMSLWAAVIFLTLCMILYIAISRVVCEGGIIFVNASMLPQTFMLRSFGAEALGYTNLVVLSLCFLWMSDLTTVFMPNLANSMKLADVIDAKRKRWMFPTTILVILIIFFVSGYTLFKIAYNDPEGINSKNRWFFDKGGHIGRHIVPYAVSPIDELNKMQRREQTTKKWYNNVSRKWPFDNYSYLTDEENTINRSEEAEYLNTIKTEPRRMYDVQPLRWLFTIGGFFFMAFLMLMRSRFMWWPLHPLGFPFAVADSTQGIWFSIFIGWLFKVLILKYGGIKLFKRLKPIFIGLIVGSLIIVFMGLIADYIFFSLGMVETGYLMSGQ